MNYTLNTGDKTAKVENIVGALKKLWPLVRVEKGKLIGSFFAILVNSGFSLLGPFLVGYAINHYVVTKNYNGVLLFSFILITCYIIAFVANYLQIRIMGGVSQRMLYRLRNTVFEKLEELPVAFFSQNKSGDLISRINNDTDKLNQFFSQALMQFVGNTVVIIGAGIFMLAIKPKLGLVLLIPALLLFVFTRLTSGWIKKRNLMALQTTGLLSAEIQESIENFKVILAFDRRDYFKKKFAGVNIANFDASVRSGIANNVLAPTFDFASNIAQLTVILFGAYLISQGQFTIGFLLSYLSYSSRFYDPLRQMASLWSSFQIALAGWERIAEILEMKSNLNIISTDGAEHKGMLEFKDVSFSYSENKLVLHDVNFVLEAGKTYALVGPTGGGKTTAASLMARLFDPTKGSIFFEGRDIRSYSHAERAQKIGFILQEPFLFSGTLRDNLMYGNARFEDGKPEKLDEALKATGLDTLLVRFDGGLDGSIKASGGEMSLGQKQIIAFIRAVLREPDILILDEATANIDTVTEELLGKILDKLPAKTTRVVIAHRLNTIENADEIFFVNGGEVVPAGSMEHAVELLLHNKRTS